MERKIFFSYSHDSKEHKNFVFSLSEKLRDLGYNSIIDQNVRFPKFGWSYWANQQMEEANVIIIFITPKYIENEGEGVLWEKILLTQFIEKISKGYIKKKIIIALYNDFEISKLNSIYSIPPRVILPDSFDELIELIEYDKDDSNFYEINDVSIKSYLKVKFPTLKLESKTGVLNDFPKILKDYGYSSFTQLDELLKVTELARKNFHLDDTFGVSAARELFIALGLVKPNAEKQFVHEEDIANLRVNRKYIIS